MILEEVKIQTLVDWLRNYPLETKIKLKNYHKQWSAFIVTEWEEHLKLMVCDELPVDVFGEYYLDEMTIELFLKEAEEYIAYDDVDVDECYVAIYYYEDEGIENGTYTLDITYEETSQTVFIQPAC